MAWRFLPERAKLLHFWSRKSPFLAFFLLEFLESNFTPLSQITCFWKWTQNREFWPPKRPNLATLLGGRRWQRREKMGLPLTQPGASCQLGGDGFLRKTSPVVEVWLFKAPSFLVNSLLYSSKVYLRDMSKSWTKLGLALGIFQFHFVNRLSPRDLFKLREALWRGHPLSERLLAPRTGSFQGRFGKQANVFLSFSPGGVHSNLQWFHLKAIGKNE